MRVLDVYNAFGPWGRVGWVTNHTTAQKPHGPGTSKCKSPNSHKVSGYQAVFNLKVGVTAMLRTSHFKAAINLVLIEETYVGPCNICSRA